MSPKHGPYNVGMKLYEPTNLVEPKNTLNIPPNLNGSAWKGMEWVIQDILDRFDVGREICLEFGTEYGFSAVAFSNFFQNVIGVDTFRGDPHSVVRDDFYETTKGLVERFPNIRLVQMSWADWTAKNGVDWPEVKPDLVHIDIWHTYEETMGCGGWAVQHSPCTLFHDTMSFPEVSWACADLANKYGKTYYNYVKDFGLGIIV